MSHSDDQMDRLPRGRHGLSPEFVARNQRDRLISALILTLAEVGYQKTTVSMIGRRAAVSKSDFYKHFDSKDDCFLAAYDYAVDRIRTTVVDACGPNAKAAWSVRVQAGVTALLTLLAGLLVLVQFNLFAIAVGAASLLLVAAYPFMKRITWWPQIVLGLAFSWGALMGFAVLLGRIDAAALWLYAGSISWVIGYDTIYAHQDAEDDALIGIKSTARLFAERTHQALVLFYSLAVVLIGVALTLAGSGPVAWIALALFAVQLGWQISRLRIGDPALCLHLFKSNREAGLVLFAGLVIDALMRAT